MLMQNENTMEIWRTSFILLSFTASVEPEDVAVLAEESVRFNCTIPGQGKVVFWERRPFGKTLQEDIFEHGRVASVFKERMVVISIQTGSFDLFINKTELEDAGYYFCQDFPSVTPKQFQLSVIESDPICSSNVTQDWVTDGSVVQIRCILSYRGNASISMVWHNANHVTLEEDLTCNFNAARHVRTCSSTMLVTYNSTNTFNELYCLTTKLLTNGNATKVYEYNWRATSYKIQYPPRNIRCIPANPILKIGEVIVCSVDSNPKSTFRWFNKMGQLVSEDAHIVMNNQTDWLKCLASNVHGVISINLTVTTESYTATTGRNENPPVSLSMWVGIYVLGGVIIICLVVCVAMSIRKRTNNIYTSRVVTPTVELDHGIEADDYAEIPTIPQYTTLTQVGQLPDPMVPPPTRGKLPPKPVNHRRNRRNPTYENT